MKLTRLAFAQHPRPPQRELRQRGVFDSGGNLIGQVQNIYVDDEGTSRFVDVATGGFMGLGIKHHLVPIGAIVEEDPGSSITLSVDRQSVQSTPALADLHAAPGETMHVRVSTMRSLEGHFDAMRRFIEEVVRPAAEGQEEFAGAIVAGDRSGNKIVTASWWSSEESLQASTRCEHLPDYQLLPAQFALSLAEQPEIEHYRLGAIS
jgi:PRC-barrel domain